MDQSPPPTSTNGHADRSDADAPDRDAGKIDAGKIDAGNVDADIRAADARWNFGGDVPEHFEGHIGKSVPHYAAGHDVVASIADFFLYDGATAYELGCSTAALTRKLADRNADRNVTIVGLEVEAAMVEQAERNTAGLRGVEIRHADVLDAEFEPADLIVSYYTIQFIRPARRQALVDRIYRSLKWGGAFVMFEKVRAPDARFQDMMSVLYSDFKLAQGFSEREIVHKTRSLKGVLEPFSSRGNADMLRRAGFVDQMTVFKHLCFEGFLAIK